MKHWIVLDKKAIEELKKTIKNMHGYRQACECNCLYGGTPVIGVTDELAYPIVWSSFKEFENYFPLKETVNETRHWLEESKKCKGHIDSYHKEFFSRVKKMAESCKKFEKIDFEKLGVEETRKKFEEIDALNYSVWHSDSFLVDKFDPEGDNFLKEELKKSNLKIEYEEIGILLKPYEMSFVDESNFELYKIAMKLKKGRKTGDDDILKALKPMKEKYYFIQNSWGNVRVLREDDFLETIKEILKEPEEKIAKTIEEYENLGKNIKKKCEEIYKKYNANEEMQNIFHLFRTLARIRDERKEAVVRAVHFYELIAKNFSKEYGIDIKLVRNAFPYELINVHNKEDMKKLLPTLKERAVASAFGKIKQDEMFIVTGKDAKEIIDIIHSKLLAGVEDIKGLVACRGKQKIITGKVKIILGETHFTKFKEGEILVTAMTRPEFIPLMKKAKAIITDEGGITCHAAIVSRELNVPCIIGTSVATKKLFDNREVEIDTETGIIKAK